MSISLTFVSALLLTHGAVATTQVVCVGSASELTDALAALSTSASNNDADEIRIRTGTYFAPAGGWVGAVTNNHDLSVAGGYVDAACTQEALDASLTVLDGNHASGVLTINANAIPNSTIHISGLTFQNGNGSSPFQSSAGGLKVGDPGPIAGGVVLIERNIFQHNVGVAGIGGTEAVGGLLAATDGPNLIVRDNLFFDNSAPNSAAAFFYSDNAIDVANNTFAGNQSTDAAQAQRVIMDFFTPTGMKLDNNIFWDNSTGAGIADIDVSGSVRHADLRNNDIQAMSGTPVSSTGALSVAPGFIGSTNFRLSASSPLIDAGVSNPNGGLSGVDLDGAQRVDGATLDLGAYESNYIFVDGFE